MVKPASSQPVLYCMVCETEMSSIKTLELHTKGTDHQKNVQHKNNSERLQNNWIRPTAVPGKYNKTADGTNVSHTPSQLKLNANLSHLSKGSSDLKQNETQRALSRGVVRFVSGLLASKNPR